MTTLRAIFTACAPASLERSPTLPTSHRTVRSAIHTCPSGPSGHRVSQCHSWGAHHRVQHAWGNRPWPPGPPHTTQQCVPHHLEQQRPGPHVLLPCPVPETLRPCLRSQHRLASHALCTASSHALKRLANDARVRGTALPGFPGGLPPWGRPLPYHPPLHDIVPGGGRSTDRDAWLPSSANFLVPVKALSPLSRAMGKEEMPKAGRLESIDPQGWTIPWNVHRQATPPPLVRPPSPRMSAQWRAPIAVSSRSRTAP